jgi:hypothetical protein
MVHDVLLQVEDDEASYFVVREIFKEICPGVRLESAQNGAADRRGLATAGRQRGGTSDSE